MTRSTRPIYLASLLAKTTTTTPHKKVVLVDAPKYGVYELQLFLLALFLMQLPKLIFFFTSTLDTVFDLRRLVSGSELDDAAVVVLVVFLVFVKIFNGSHRRATEVPNPYRAAVMAHPQSRPLVESAAPPVKSAAVRRSDGLLATAAAHTMHLGPQTSKRASVEESRK